ncbi:MAG: lysozyme inhibitor LprI family protein [Chthoniobacterales bacterium]
MKTQKFLLLLLFSIFLSASAVRAQSKVVPPDWLPALHPSIENALEQLKDANAQQEMNRLSRQIAEMRDAQLYIAYVRLYQKLGTKERAALLTEQTKWLKARVKAAKAEVESEGGSLAALEANNAEVTFTEKRLKELRDRYKKASSGKEDDDE